MSAINIGSTNSWGYGLEPVVIRHYEDGIKGGKVLDVTGFTEDVIQCGHVIIKKTIDGVDNYRPMPVSNGAYGTLTSGYSYAGICVTTVPVTEPIVGIMTSGEVNDKAVPFSMSSILSAFKTAVPTIRFDHD